METVGPSSLLNTRHHSLSALRQIGVEPGGVYMMGLSAQHKHVFLQAIHRLQLTPTDQIHGTELFFYQDIFTAHAQNNPGSSSYYITDESYREHSDCACPIWP